MIKVAPISDIGLEKWFEIGEPPEDLNRASELLAQRLKAERKASSYIRLAAFSDNNILGRFSARRDMKGERLTLGFPTYRKELSDSVKNQIAVKLIEFCIEFAASARPKYHYIENKPADDVSDLEIWISALEHCGFRFIAASHLLTKTTLILPDLPTDTAEMKIVPGERFSYSQLKKIFKTYQQYSLDRADSDSLQGLNSSFKELITSTDDDSNPPLSCVCVYHKQPIGLIVVRVNSEVPPEKLSGIILSVGVIPAYRQMGAGKLLLASGIDLLRSLGVKEFQALIDDQNTPSLKLHLWAGFKPEPERYMVYRKKID